MSLARSLNLALVVAITTGLVIVDGRAQQKPANAELAFAGGHRLNEDPGSYRLNEDSGGYRLNEDPGGNRLNQDPNVASTGPAENTARANADTGGTRNKNGTAPTQPATDKRAVPDQPEPPEALFLPAVDRLTPLDEAYLDVFSILRGDNSCSAFYGGPSAIEVLNQLKQQLKPTYLDSRVAVRMSGPVQSVLSLRYRFSYRLFDKAELNLRGSFYHSRTFGDEFSAPPIGGFAPNTREARVTILLHELGHLIAKPDKQWLFPNDGNNEYLSHKITERVVAACGEQIRHLKDISFAQQLQAARSLSATAGPQAATHLP